MKAERAALESQKAEYEEKLRGLKAFARELKEMAARHATDGTHCEDALKKATHDAQFYEAELGRIGDELKGATDDLAFRVFRDAAGEWRWHLRASNNRVVADSGEGYRERDDCLRGIELVKHSANAPVEEKP